jgi:DNA-binding beta-propeller fold protein YncE
VLVIDVQHAKQIGTIADTQGVHGIAVAQDLKRGFTSNGKNATVTAFDLDTLKPVAVITGTGEKPDAIVYDTRLASRVDLQWQERQRQRDRSAKK